MKKGFLFYLAFFFLCYTSSFQSQQNKIQEFPLNRQNAEESAIITYSSDSHSIFYSNKLRDSIFFKRTFDGGWSWTAEKFIIITGRNSFIQEALHMTVLRSNSGRLFIAWSVYNDSMRIIRSDDDGNSWSIPVKLAGSPLIPFRSENLNLSQLQNDKIILTFNSLNGGRIAYLTSEDDGDTWNEAIDLEYAGNTGYIRGKDFSYISLDENLVLGICSQNRFFNTELISLRASKNSLNKPDTTVVFSTSDLISRFRLQKTDDNVLWIVYQIHKSTVISDFKQYDIYYLTSEDNGFTWSQPQRYTNYLGDDFFHSISTYQNQVFCSFFTRRFNNIYGLAFADLTNTSDSNYPPYVIHQWVNSQQEETFNFRAKIIHDDPDLAYQIVAFDTLNLGEIYDDGSHNDDQANDYIYGNNFRTPIPQANDVMKFAINKITLNFDKVGNLGGGYSSITIPIRLIISKNLANLLQTKNEFNLLSFGGFGGNFENVVFLFSGGFMISGTDLSGTWANGVMHSALLQDYLPGKIGSEEKGSINKIYLIRSDDKPFGSSWQEWKKAVDLGAEFYDGDNDGIFNPVDKNYNGVWDLDEDMPLLLGDATAWFVMNDGVPANLRRWQSEPKKIEIEQTIFASSLPELENVIFLRYKITNRSILQLDSVYFGFYNDADLGDPSDDLAGCDTLLNSGFIYNDSADPEFGVNPPAFFTTLLQGPVISSNNDDDTAYVRLGTNYHANIFTSASNQDITSHIRVFKGSPGLSDPYSIEGVHNYLRGLTHFGEVINPCTFFGGKIVGGTDCSQVNPLFWFSGDPVQQVGWIDKIPMDLRNSLNTGPFMLRPDKSQEIIAAYVIGRGSDALNSITVTREIVNSVIEEYKNNFSSLTYKSENPVNPVVSYELYQNYPNPFNHSTKIRFALPEYGLVSIKVFDVLGREVITLVNEFRVGNRYEITFDASDLSSGVYFYQLQSNNYIKTKKMIYLR